MEKKKTLDREMEIKRNIRKFKQKRFCNSLYGYLGIICRALESN